MFPSLALVTSLAVLPTAISAGEAQGFLRQAGGVTADETGTYVPCLDASDLSFDLTIVEDDQDFQICRKELQNKLKQKVSLCSDGIQNRWSLSLLGVAHPTSLVIVLFVGCHSLTSYDLLLLL
jgi:hypothetical protein